VSIPSGSTGNSPLSHEIYGPDTFKYRSHDEKRQKKPTTVSEMIDRGVEISMRGAFERVGNRLRPYKPRSPTPIVPSVDLFEASRRRQLREVGVLVAVTTSVVAIWLFFYLLRNDFLHAIM